MLLYTLGCTPPDTTGLGGSSTPTNNTARDTAHDTDSDTADSNPDDYLLYETFDAPSLDTGLWLPVADTELTEPPRVDDGWLVYDDTETYPVYADTALETLFDGDSHLLQLHVATGDDPTLIVAFGLQSGTDGLDIYSTGTLFYYWPETPDDPGQATLRAFTYQSGEPTNVVTGTLAQPAPAEHAAFTIAIDGQSLVVHAGEKTYETGEDSLVLQIDHGITDPLADGPLYFKLEADGRYRLDEVFAR